MQNIYPCLFQADRGRYDNRLLHHSWLRLTQGKRYFPLVIPFLVFAIRPRISILEGLSLTAARIWSETLILSLNRSILTILPRMESLEVHGFLPFRQTLLL